MAISVAAVPEKAGQETEGPEQTPQRGGPFPGPLLRRGEDAAQAPTTEAVYAALWSNAVLRNLEYGHITVTTNGHLVILQGHVIAAHTRQRAEQIVRGVPGVEAVENRLVDDDDLVYKVCLALAKDLRTQHEIILVAACHGVIVLSGTVGGIAARDVAEECAARVSQVRGVSNYIEAPGVVVRPEAERVLQPRIGEEVIAADMPLGWVAGVIINPHNRRVAHFVAHGEFPDLASHGYRCDSYDVTALDQPITIRERSVVIPRQAIAEITRAAVWLRVSANEAARYPDFDPSCFRSPGTTWQPPYPYEPGDIWLDVYSLGKEMTTWTSRAI